MSYEAMAQRSRELSQRMRDEPIDFVRKAMVCSSQCSTLDILVD
jgi:hypothetical protein